MKVAIAKGRIEKAARDYFEQVGLTVWPEKRGRELTVEVDGHEFIFVKGDDVYKYVMHGAADVGVVGGDILREKTWCPRSRRLAVRSLPNGGVWPETTEKRDEEVESREQISEHRHLALRIEATKRRSDRFERVRRTRSIDRPCRLHRRHRRDGGDASGERP